MNHVQVRGDHARHLRSAEAWAALGIKRYHPGGNIRDTLRAEIDLRYL